MILNPPSVIIDAFGAGQSTTAFLRYLQSGDANDFFNILGDGTLKWGPGGGTAIDTILARTAAGRLTLTSSLVLSGLTLGSVLFAGTSGLISQDNANLFYDSTNSFLGIGIATPLSPLHVFKSTTLAADTLVRVSAVVNPSGAATTLLCQDVTTSITPANTQTITLLQGQRVLASNNSAATLTTLQGAIYQAINGIVFGAASGTALASNITGITLQAVQNSLSTGTVASISGANFSSDTRGPAAVTNLFGYSMVIGASHASAIITNFYGSKISTVGALGAVLTAGTLTNSYFMFIDPFPAATGSLIYTNAPVQLHLAAPVASTHIAIRQLGSSSLGQNRFQSFCKFGADSAPAVQMDIVGSIAQATGQTGLQSTAVINNPPLAMVFDEATTNLVSNPSFEVDTTGWSAVGANASISRVTTQQSSGDASLQIVVTPAAANQGTQLAAFAISANTAYVFSVDLKGNAGAESIYLNIVYDVGAPSVGVGFTLTTSFNRLRLAVTSPIGSATATVQILTNGSQVATWFADAVQFEQKTGMTSYCDGSLGLGYTWAGTAHNSNSSRTAGARWLAPLNSNLTSRWGVRPDGSIGAAKMIFRAAECVPSSFVGTDSPFVFTGAINALTALGTAIAVLRANNDSNGPALWCRSAATSDVGVVIETPSITSGIVLALAVPADLTGFTGEYFGFVTKGGVRQYQWSKIRQRIGVNNDALQKYIEAYGGGGYTTALQANFTGTVTVAIGFPTVTGVGTTFLTQYKVDDTIVLDTATTKIKKRIISITSNTVLTTDTNYAAVLTATTHTQPVTQYSPFGVMFESAGGDHANLSQADYSTYMWFNKADRPKILRGAAVNAIVTPTADTDGLYLTHELARTSAQVVVASSITETTVFTATVPANRLGTTGTLRLRVLGRYLFNNGGANTINLRCKYGATTLIASGAISPPGGVSAVRRAFVWDVFMTNVGVTNSQKMIAHMTADTDTTDFSGTDHFTWHAYGTSAIDSQTDQALTLTIQWGTSSANNSFEVEFATLEAV